MCERSRKPNTDDYSFINSQVVFHSHRRLLVKINVRFIYINNMSKEHTHFTFDVIRLKTVFRDALVWYEIITQKIFINIIVTSKRYLLTKTPENETCLTLKNIILIYWYLTTIDHLLFIFLHEASCTFYAEVQISIAFLSNLPHSANTFKLSSSSVLVWIFFFSYELEPCRFWQNQRWTKIISTFRPQFSKILSGKFRGSTS